MTTLADLLGENKDQIMAHLFLGSVDWEKLVERVSGSSAAQDEQLWTFLAACGYAIAGSEGVKQLTEILAGTGLHHSNSRIWLEAMPMSPRKKEGNTHLDLALGTIRRRSGTCGGIELDEVTDPWVCFCEMKLFSDLSHGVTHDPHRNQLARVAENALCFQSGGQPTNGGAESRYASRTYVTLVTPKAFRFAPVLSRLYQYKFREYATDRWELVKDLDLCGMMKRDEPPDWRYPSNVADRVQRLELRWVTYEELFENLPCSPISEQLKAFGRSTGEAP